MLLVFVESLAKVRYGIKVVSILLRLECSCSRFRCVDMNTEFLDKSGKCKTGAFVSSHFTSANASSNACLLTPADLWLSLATPPCIQLRIIGGQVQLSRS